MNNDMHWYGFHTDHDFCYLHRILTGSPLSDNQELFIKELNLLFPNLYDIKVIAD